MLSIILTILFFALSIPVHAAPTISSAGNAVDGNILVISGAGFGSKSTAAPLWWDNMEAGTNATALTNGGYTYYGQAQYAHYYTNAQSHSGSQSAYRHVDAGDINDERWSASVVNNLDSDNLFMSVWIRFNRSAGGVCKIFRVNDSTTNFYSGTPHAWYSANSLNTYHYHGFINDAPTDYGENGFLNAPLSNDTWYRIDMWLQNSTGGSANGSIYWYANQVAMGSLTSIVTRTVDTYKTQSVLLFGMPDTPGAADFYIDDIYIDDTQARIEICNSSDGSWANRSDCEIQPIIDWTADEITITVNQGVFVDDTAYLFVVDSDGDASIGYEIAFGEIPTTSHASGNFSMSGQ
jgi:hypothetical protein